MLLCEKKQWAEKAKFWASQSREPVQYYEHREVGYNYRLSNILAGIGCGQLQTLEEFVDKRRYINLRYRMLLEHLPVDFEPVFPGGRSNCWLTVMTIHEGCRVTVTDLISALADRDIESRAFWKPMHCQPVFASYPFYPHRENESVGERLFCTGICLPSGTALTDGDLERISAVNLPALSGNPRFRTDNRA
jgi:pyridoxal phosphate-dependent aminotransferase EpsN